MQFNHFRVVNCYVEQKLHHHLVSLSVGMTYALECSLCVMINADQLNGVACLYIVAWGDEKSRCRLTV